MYELLLWLLFRVCVPMDVCTWARTTVLLAVQCIKLDLKILSGRSWFVIIVLICCYNKSINALNSSWQKSHCQYTCTMLTVNHISISTLFFSLWTVLSDIHHSWRFQLHINDNDEIKSMGVVSGIEVIEILFETAACSMVRWRVKSKSSYNNYYTEIAWQTCNALSGKSFGTCCHFSVLWWQAGPVLAVADGLYSLLSPSPCWNNDQCLCNTWIA